MAQKFQVEVHNKVFGKRTEVVEAKSVDEAKVKVQPKLESDDTVGKVLQVLED